jgi:hypothetical protein
MLAFLVLTVLSWFLVWHIKGHINPSFQRHYVFFSMAIILLGFVAIFIYTIDNYHHGQVDLPGDAQYYYESALSYLQTGETQTIYPNYEKFLATFLIFGDPILARLAQLMLFFFLYALSIRALDRLNVSQSGLIYFSTFTAFSGIYYGTLVVLARDVLILFAYAFVFFVLVWYYTRAEARRRTPNASLLFLIVLAAIWLHSLGPWLIYPLIAGVLGELMVFYFKKEGNWRLGLVGIIVVVFFLFYEGFSEIQRLYQHNVVEQALFMARKDIPETATRWRLIEPFVTLLGPGLIRPLFPSEYFLVWIPSHASFNWWGTFFWYINLIFSLPLVFRKPFAFLGKRGAVFALVVFVFLVGAYTLAYGSGMGMRKRMMFHFLYTLFIATAYYTPLGAQNSAYAQKQVFPLPASLVRLGVLLMLMVATIMSVDWN